MRAIRQFQLNYLNQVFARLSALQMRTSREGQTYDAFKVPTRDPSREWLALSLVALRCVDTGSTIEYYYERSQILVPTWQVV
jgi:hypothetical protein